MRLPLLLVLPALLAGPVLTASGSVPPTTSGLGSAAISGYEVSSIDYELDAETIEAVTFDLAPADAGTVKVRLAPAAPWTTCAVAGAAVSCPVATTIASAAALEVVAAG